MIPINTEIHRLTSDEHEGRKLIVTLGPPNTITLRPQGLRKEVASVTAGQLWALLRDAPLPSLAPRAFTTEPAPETYPPNAGDVPGRPVHPSTELAHHFAIANLRLHNVLDKRGPSHAEALKVAQAALVWALDLSLFQSGQITEEEWKRRSAAKNEPIQP